MAEFHMPLDRVVSVTENKKGLRRSPLGVGVQVVLCQRAIDGRKENRWRSLQYLILPRYTPNFFGSAAIEIRNVRARVGGGSAPAHYFPSSSGSSCLNLCQDQRLAPSSTKRRAKSAGPPSGASYRRLKPFAHQPNAHKREDKKAQ